MEAKEIRLSDEDIYYMIESSLGHNAPASGFKLDMIVASDFYGPHKHCTWVFSGDAVGVIERYWGGLKMVCSVFGSPPRTSFFTEDGNKTTNRGLKGPKLGE